MRIQKLEARKVLTSALTWTVEVDALVDGKWGRASVPAGTSAGIREAALVSPEDAVSNVKSIISDVLLSKFFDRLAEVDATMIEVDGTFNKSSLGANATLAVSQAVLCAAASSLNIPPYQYIRNEFVESDTDLLPASCMPVPWMNVLNGGAHGNKGGTSIQEFMIACVSANSFAEAMEMYIEVYHCLKRVLETANISTNVGMEGGFGAVGDTREVLNHLISAITMTGYQPGIDVVIGIDAAASEFYDSETGVYTVDGDKLDSEGMVTYWQDLVEYCPFITSIEDGMAEQDFNGWNMLSESIGDKVQLVGDDLFCTNSKILKTGIEEGWAPNAILIKTDQIGTVSEAIAAIHTAHLFGMKWMISHRSKETESAFISHLAVAMGGGQIKTGSSRGERTAKYNELFRIAGDFGDNEFYPGRRILPAGCKWK